MSRFNDKVVLITGAASGIGKASAERIASEGGKVICVDIQKDAVEAVAAGINASEGRGEAIALVCDITDQSSVNDTVASAIAKFGQLDALCNIAGTLRFDNTLEAKMDDFKRVMDINCYGPFMMCQAAIPHLLETKGYIVNMSSSAALGAHAWTAAYSASKGALLSLTRCLAVEFGLKGINSNAICPGGIATPMLAGAATQMPKDIDQRLLNKVRPLDNYYADPSEVASAVAFLACDDAKFINGDHIRLDGGMMS